MKNNIQKSKYQTGKKGKRLGRGYGSGKGGHTSSRGQKGQKARSSIGILFEGVKMKKSLIKRLPLKRGRLKNSPKNAKPYVISIDKLISVYKSGDVVTVSSLVQKGLIKEDALNNRGVKILGSIKGDLKHNLKFDGVRFSNSVAISANNTEKIKSEKKEPRKNKKASSKSKK